MTVAAGTTGSVPENTGYLARHWRGELSLAQSYWINGVVVSLPFRFYFGIVSAVFAASHFESPLTALTWIVFPFLLMVPVLIWQGVGIWRSAGRRIHAGKPGWAWVARIIVLGNACALAFNGFVYAALTWSLSIAYFDERSARYQADIVEHRVVFSGEITPASADRLSTLLQTKGVDRLVIRQSVGGYLYSSLRIAQLVHDRRVTVIATGGCASMCTVILAAGPQRFVMPTTVIRLHTGYMVGTHATAEDWSDAENWYLKAGMGQDLLAKIRAHKGPYDLYEPTLSEAIANGLMTAVYDKNIQLFVPAQQWCAQNSIACSRTGSQNAAAAGKR